MRRARPSDAPRRLGFTIAEMTVVVSIGSIIILAALQVIITQTRQYTTEAESLQIDGNLRAAASVLTSAFLEVSASEGDILAIGADSVTLRAPRGGGVVCAWTATEDHMWLGLGDVSGALVAGDSAFVYDVADDSWRRRRIEEVRTGRGATNQIEACFYGDSTAATAPRVSTVLRFEDAIDTLHIGTLVRSFEMTTFATERRDDFDWLTRRVGDGEPQLLVGPLARDDGLALAYFDSDGNTTADPSRVARVEALLVGVSAEPVSGGIGFLSDSLRVAARVRN